MTLAGTLILPTFHNWFRPCSEREAQCQPLEHHNLQPHRFFSALMELPPQEAFVADLYLPLSLETSSCRKWLNATGSSLPIQFFSSIPELNNILYFGVGRPEPNYVTSSFPCKTQPRRSPNLQKI